MNACSRLERCPFFNDKMENMPAMAEIYKTRYCTGTSEECARNRVAGALGPENVPSGMYPNDHASADSMLQQFGG